MTILWVLLVISSACAAAAGFQAVRLLHDAGQTVEHAALLLAAETAMLDQAQKRLEAQQILLEQAGAWMRAARPGP